MDQPRFGFGAIERNNADILIRLAIDEDLDVQGDLTSAALLPSGASAFAGCRSCRFLVATPSVPPLPHATRLVDGPEVH